MALSKVHYRAAPQRRHRAAMPRVCVDLPASPGKNRKLAAPSAPKTSAAPVSASRLIQ
jgi:hypothetical protein